MDLSALSARAQPPHNLSQLWFLSMVGPAFASRLRRMPPDTAGALEACLRAYTERSTGVLERMLEGLPTPMSALPTLVQTGCPRGKDRAVLFRGTTLEAFRSAFPGRPGAGSVLTLASVCSTSLVPQVAGDFLAAPHNCFGRSVFVTISVEIGEGRPAPPSVAEYSDDDQYEVLFPRGSAFRLVSRREASPADLERRFGVAAVGEATLVIGLEYLGLPSPLPR